jgi:hypothetical protein
MSFNTELIKWSVIGVLYVVFEILINVSTVVFPGGCLIFDEVYVYSIISLASSAVVLWIGVFCLTKVRKMINSIFFLYILFS